MELEAAILALAALAQATRLDVFRILMNHEPKGLPAGEIARELVVPQNTMSAHLAILLRADLVTSERRGRSIIYRANIPALTTLMRFMVEDCCGGSPELCGPLAESLRPCCPPKKKKAHARPNL